MPKFSSLPVRPTSKGYIALARAVGIASSVAAGVAIALGTVPDAIASGNLLNVAIPVILAGVVPFGLSAGWHKLYGYAAHAREVHERAIALGFGGLLFLIGMGSSAWFLASLLGGPSALSDYQAASVERARAAFDVVTANAALETNIIAALNTASGNLASVARDERGSGTMSGRPGNGPVSLGLKNAAASMATMQAGLARQQQERADALARSGEALANASRDIAARDAATFQDDMAKAVAEIRAAAKIRLGVASLNIGLAVPAEAEPVINQTTTAIAAVMTDINSRRRAVTMPDYQPIDAKRAMLTNPQPLAWLAAIVVELLPLVALGLLLTLWRDEEQPAPPDSDNDIPPFLPEHEDEVPFDPMPLRRQRQFH
jgi:hypothetical protein